MSNLLLPVPVATNKPPPMEYHPSPASSIISSGLSFLCSLQLILYLGLLTAPPHLVFSFCSFILFVPTLKPSSADQSGLQSKADHGQPHVPKLAESNKAEEERERKPSMMVRPESASPSGGREREFGIERCGSEGLQEDARMEAF